MKQYHVDEKNPIPLYYQLKELLVKDIENGIYPVGTEIPSETEFVENLHLSRTTVRQAILALVNEGYLERAKGKGTKVLKTYKSVNYIKSFTPFYQQMAVMGKKELKTKVLSSEIVTANEIIAQKLNLDMKAKVIRLKRLRFGDNVPMVVIQNYLPYDACKFILSHNFETESLFEVLFSSVNTKPMKTKTVCSAILSDSKVAGLLKIKEGDPILRLENLSKTNDDTLIDYGISFYRGDLNQFEIEAIPQF